MLFFAAILAFLGWRVFASLRDGEVGVKVFGERPVIRRRDRPIVFWLIIAVHILFMAIFLLLVVVGSLFRPSSQVP